VRAGQLPAGWKPGERGAAAEAGDPGGRGRHPPRGGPGQDAEGGLGAGLRGGAKRVGGRGPDPIGAGWRDGFVRADGSQPDRDDPGVGAL